MGKILSIILIAVILGTIGTLGYVITVPNIEEKFTEFYILGPDGKAGGYPKYMRVGEEGRLIASIINQEHETMSYRMELNIDGISHNEIGPIVLPHGGKWEREVAFTMAKGEDNQKVEFLLYKQGQSEVYRSLHLWVNVMEK